MPARSLLALSVVVATSVAGATDFQHVLGGPDLDRGVYVSPTEDGGYITVGVTASAGAGGDDVYLLKFDAGGDTTWTRTYGGADSDNGWCVQEIDSGYIVAGYTRSFGEGGFDFYLVATDSVGVVQWERTYGGEADDRCWSLLPTRDGGYALLGETLSSGAGEEDLLLIKTDAAGEEEWARTYGGAEGDRGFSIAGADDGGFVLVGQTFSEGAGDRDAYVIKTDPEGRKEWSRTFGGPASDVGHGVEWTADGNILVIGYTTSFATTHDDPYLIKIDPTGETLWTRVHAIEGVGRTITGTEASDGGLFLVGFRHDPISRATAALLIRTDPSGELEWSRDFLLTTEGQSFGYTVNATTDGGCVFTGHTTVGSAGELDLLLVRVDGKGP